MDPGKSIIDVRVYKFLQNQNGWYWGMIQKSERHGFGVYHEYQSGTTYEGYWINDIPNGFGQLTVQNKKVIGEWYSY